MREAWGQSFDVPTGYLDTATIGIPPVSAADAVAETVAGWRSGRMDAPDFDHHVARAREAFARLVGVPTEMVACGASVSQLVGLVAAAVPAGSRVLVPRGEFTSVSFPFAAQEDRGITVSEVDIAELPAMAREHDVVAASVVQSADGALLDLPALRAAAAAAGTRVLLDVTQAAGWLPLSLDWADWVVGGSYKWLLAPRGAAWLAVRPDVMHELTPIAANWYAGADPWDSVYGLPLRLADSARRLDTSPVWFAQVGASAVLPWLAGVDLGRVRARCTRLAEAVANRLGVPAQGGTILAVGLSIAAVERLAIAGVRAAVRAGRVRLSFHLYNDESDVAAVLHAVLDSDRHRTIIS